MNKTQRNGDRNLEDVTATIKQIKNEKNSKGKKTLTRILMLLFFPFGAIIIFLRYIFSKRKLRLTTKTTVIFTAIFGFLIASYITVILLVFNDFRTAEGANYNEVMVTMLILSIGLAVVFIFIGASTGALISSAMLKPIRIIITELGAIDSDNLSVRLGAVDSQDEIMELVEQINAMLDNLEESFERQSNFVSDASHELKTPLSVISGYSDLLMRWGKTEADVLDEGISTIKRESLYMSKIIDQMLILARLGGLNMHKQALNISDTVLQIVEGYKIINADNNISVYGDADVIGDCDRTLLTEAVRALIDNAIKYTQKGKPIMVIVNGGAEPEIKIKDSGAGIDEQDLPYIFDRFYRCDKTRGREKGSAGLGLTICKNIIEMMGGKISVKSVKGEGSEFTIKLMPVPKTHNPAFTI